MAFSAIHGAEIAAVIALLAMALASVVCGIAVLHAAWGLGSHWPAGSAEALAKSAVGTPGIRRMPGPASCLTVAVLLAGVASWPLFASGLLPEAWPPPWLTQIAGAGIVAVFLGRGIAGFTRAWRQRFPEQPFATFDRRYYSPLCLALGAGYLVILIAGRNP
jgi:Protein of unknown function (DUF3995)